MKRIFLFLLVNIAVLAVLSVVVSVLGVDRYLTQRGINYESLLILSAVMGMGGAFISLAMSKWLAKKSVGAQVLTEPTNAGEAWLLSTVERLALAAGVGKPEVAVYPSPDINAFATGMSKNHSLVAVSSGLLQSMNQEQAEAVLGHEMTHIANGDMVTLTLIQGVVNTFVFFLARVIGFAVDNAVFRREGDNRGGGIGYFFTVMILQILLGFLATMIVCAFSRWREYRADAGGAHLAGRRKMISALQKLKQVQEQAELPPMLTAFAIHGGKVNLFASHPPLDKRIAALEASNEV